MVRHLIATAFAFAPTLIACSSEDPGSNGTLGPDVIVGQTVSVDPTLPCDPWEGRTNITDGKLEIALESANRRFFVLRSPNSSWLRLFEWNGVGWAEQNPPAMQAHSSTTQSIRFKDLEDKEHLIVYSKQHHFGGIAPAPATSMNIASFQALPGFEALSIDKDFTRPDKSMIKTEGIGKGIRYYGEFGQGEHILILSVPHNTPTYGDGIFVGPENAVAGPPNSARLRLKDGGSRRYNFEHDENKGSLRYINSLDEPRQEWKLLINDSAVDLVDKTYEVDPAKLLERLTFTHCQRAHTGVN